MDSSRAKKSQSLALDSKTGRQQTAQRPGPGDRRTSAPTVTRSRHSTAKPPSEGTRDLSITNHSSRSSAPQESSTRRDALRSARPEEQPRDSRSKSKGKSASPTSTELPHVNLAVVGARGVGKSAFIQRALDLRKPAAGLVSSSKVGLDGVVYRFQLWELSLDDIDYSDRRHIVWPKYINSRAVPSMDGAICLYDVTSQESIAEVPELLLALSKAAIPCVLTACKCDLPSHSRQVDSRFNDQVNSAFPGVRTCDTSTGAPQSQQKCILTALKSILAASRDSSRQVSPYTTRARAATTFDRTKRASVSASRNHSRSKSDYPRSRPQPYDTPQTSSEVLPEFGDTKETSSEHSEEDSEADEEDEDEDDEDDVATEKKVYMNRQPLRLDTSPSPGPQTRPYEPQTPVSAGEQYLRGLMSPFDGSISEIPQTPESFNITSVLRPGTANTSDSRAHQTFLDLEEESQDESSQSEMQSSVSEMEKFKTNKKTPVENGVTFAELVGRLLQLPTSKQDAKFGPTFLCLYRAFSTPKQLLTAIIGRFNEVENSPIVQQFNKVALQLRYLQVIGEWTASYPGDFSDLSTRENAGAFVRRLEKSRSFGPAAKEIGNNLEAQTGDDDIVWAYSDSADPKPHRTPTLTPQSNTGPASPNKSAKDARGRRAEILPWEYPTGDDSNDEELNEDRACSPRHSGGPSISSNILKNTTNASSQSLTNLLNLEQARMKAQRLRPVPRNRLSKIQWHQFMDTPSEDFAKEVTRIDWIMYSAIRPRDFVRHVMVSSHDRSHSACRMNDNIGAMVKHFNHLAVFVSGMVLLRDKPKHRAKAVEKFMDIAWKVRQLNNYNSLGAIVAGINGHEIARLNQTRELVPPKVQKDFLRLTILMGLSRGHAAYRLAWENSFSERIPFVPLLRQDLTLAESGMRTWIENGEAGKVNWRKFEVMGEVIVMIQNSQRQGYKFGVRDNEVVKLILETRVLDGAEVRSSV